MKILYYIKMPSKRGHIICFNNKINREKWFILFIENRFIKISDTDLLTFI